jgi:hypothetical protein
VNAQLLIDAIVRQTTVLVAVFDHFQAVVKAVVARLRSDGPGRSTGGSTYSFEIWPGHPFEQEVIGLLDELRQRTGELKKKVSAFNGENDRPSRVTEVTFYGGQSVLEQAEDDDGDETLE